MRVVFADACYWIAIANPKDQLHAKAMGVNRSIGDMHIFTTDEVQFRASRVYPFELPGGD